MTRLAPEVTRCTSPLKLFWSERTEVPVPRYWFFFPVWSPSSAWRPCGPPLIASDETEAATVTTSPPAARSEHLPHQPEQAPALAGVERGAPRRLGQDLAVQPLPDGLALGGEHDVLAPPVPQRGFPPGQPVLLQGVRD